MGIEEIGVGATGTSSVATLILIGGDEGEQLLIDMVGLLAIVQTRPEVDAPASAPACGLVAFLNQRLFAGF